MTDSYGPGDTSIPEWTPPTDSPPAPTAAAPSRGAAAPAQNYGAPMGAPTPTHRSWQPGIIPLRPLTFGDFLSYPFKAMRYNKAVVVGGPLACSLAATLVTIVALWLFFTDPGFTSFDPYATDFGTTGPAGSGIRLETILALVVAGILWFLADAFARAIVAPGVARAVLGERISLGEAWRIMRARFWPILGLYGIATVVTAVPIAIFFALIGLAAVDNSGGGLAAVLLLGIPALIAGGIVYTIAMGIAVPLIVLERGRIFASIRRTFALLKGRFWWTVLITFVASILINIASSIVQYAVQFAGLIVFAIAPDAPAVATGAIVATGALAVLFAAILVYSYMGSLFTFVYIDLRIRHEGFDSDLAEAAEARAGR